MKIKSVIIVFLSLFCISAYADQVQPAAGEHHMPPKEAIDACSGKAKDDACSFTGLGGGNMEGVCFGGPDGKGVLACAPKPPKEAVDACTGKNVGDACSFTGKNSDKIDGSCFKLPTSDVACRPEKGPEPMKEKPEAAKE